VQSSSNDEKKCFGFSDEPAQQTFSTPSTATEHQKSPAGMTRQTQVANSITKEIVSSAEWEGRKKAESLGLVARIHKKFNRLLCDINRLFKVSSGWARMGSTRTYTEHEKSKHQHLT
jgi:hypothetical protein